MSRAWWFGLLALALLGQACSTARARRAEEQILALHAGALLVRLPPANTDKAGPASGADSIVGAFREHFSFCPVYFAFADDPGRLYRATNGATGLRPLAGGPPEPLVLMASFGTVYDTPLLSEADGRPRQAGGVGGLPGLVVQNLEGVQLEAPFPYRVTTNYRPDDLGRAVRVLQNRLEAYHLQAQRRALRRSRREDAGGQ